MADRWGIALLTVGLLAGSGVHTADKQAEAMQKTVVEAGEKFAKAFAKQDAKAIAALFTEEAEYIDEAGTVFHGRGAIEDEFTADFAVAPAGTIALELLSIRLIGTWHEEVDGTTISTTWDWSEDGNFLLSEFTIRRSAESVTQGTHRVGWDAERQQFRSWVFRNTGAAGEGWWRSNEDDSWTVNLTVIDVDGVRSSSLVSYGRDGKDTLRDIKAKQKLERAFPLLVPPAGKRRSENHPNEKWRQLGKSRRADASTLA